MKKLMITALLVVGMTAFAQEKKAPETKRAAMEQMTPEQRNELRVKQLTLELGLNASQQKDMSKLVSEQSAKREKAMAERKAKAEKKEKLTADQRFAKKSQMLDEQIAMKEKVKKILTPEQFEKWEKMKGHNKQKMHKRMEKRKGKMKTPEDN